MLCCICIVLYFIVLHYIALYCIVLYCIVLHCIALHCIPLRCVALLYCFFLFFSLSTWDVIFWGVTTSENINLNTMIIVTGPLSVVLHDDKL